MSATATRGRAHEHLRRLNNIDRRLRRLAKRQALGLPIARGEERIDAIQAELREIRQKVEAELNA